VSVSLRGAVIGRCGASGKPNGHCATIKAAVRSDEAIPTTELKEAEVIAEGEADRIRAGPHRWSQAEAREAARLSRESRATRKEREPPSDAEIERGLRERAVSDPRAAEILLRWLQRPRAEESVGGVDLGSLPERQLERLYAGSVRLARLDGTERAALLEHVLGGESSSRADSA
jgi:hypothetical protein